MLKENPLTFSGYFPGLFISIFSHLPASAWTPGDPLSSQKQLGFPTVNFSLVLVLWGFFPITFVFMPVCVLDFDQDILFFLTSSLRDGFSSKATVLLSEKLLRSQSREDFLMRGDSAGSFPSQDIL